MKQTLFILLFFQAICANADTIKKLAVTRDDQFNVKIDKVILTDLISKNSYDGRFFKIVNGKSNKAVSFDDNEELQLKAATTYYHLNKARKYFTEIVGSSYVSNLPQLIIRLDLTNVFNEVGHFANDHLDPQYNNALSVPSGKGYEPKQIDPWNMEIWFRPSKEIRLKDLGSQESLKGSVVSFRNQFHMINFEQFITSLLQNKISGTNANASSIMRLIGSSVLIEAIYQSTDIASAFFSRKNYFLNSALVPEIIYHEFAHIALSDHLELTHSTPVNEGVADFFAGKIANSKKLATHIKKYNLFNGKEVRKKQLYRQAFERGELANTDFVFGLLWNVGEAIGAENAAKFMYMMSEKMDTNSSINTGLVQATLETCKELCTDPLNDRIKLYKLYYSKNL